MLGDGKAAPQRALLVAAMSARCFLKTVTHTAATVVNEMHAWLSCGHDYKQ